MSRYELDQESGLLKPRQRDVVRPRHCSMGSAQQVLVGLSSSPSDPNWANVVLLLDADSGTITDKSTSAKTPTITGQVAASNTVTKFGQKTMVFDGSGDNLSFSSSSDFNVGAGDYTFEMWYYPTDLAKQNTLFRFDGGSTYNPQLMLFSDGKAYLRSAQTSGNIGTPTTHNLSTNTMYHIEVDKSGTTYYVFIDGVQLFSGTSSAVVSENKTFYVGDASSASPAGYIYGVRLTKSVARHTAGFTPPSAPLPQH